MRPCLPHPLPCCLFPAVPWEAAADRAPCRAWGRLLHNPGLLQAAAQVPPGLSVCAFGFTELLEGLCLGWRRKIREFQEFLLLSPR